ncbi:MAG: hypothetical protein F4W93_13275 [Dehalococcoidia bacterium]|nr:hypothetical protein [Dehalococcoidia bacterium]
MTSAALSGQTGDASMSGIVAWSPAVGKMLMRVGRRDIPLAMHDHIAAELLAVLDIDPSIATPIVRHPDGGRMHLS